MSIRVLFGSSLLLGLEPENIEQMRARPRRVEVPLGTTELFVFTAGSLDELIERGGAILIEIGADPAEIAEAKRVTRSAIRRTVN